MCIRASIVFVCVCVFVSLFEQVCRGVAAVNLYFKKSNALVLICVKPDVPWSIPPTAILHGSGNSSRFSTHSHSAQKSRFAVETWTPKSIYRIHRLYIYDDVYCVYCVCSVYRDVWPYAHRKYTQSTCTCTHTNKKKLFPLILALDSPIYGSCTATYVVFTYYAACLPCHE